LYIARGSTSGVGSREGEDWKDIADWQEEEEEAMAWKRGVAVATVEEGDEKANCPGED
jgi:hypothetical protein